MHRWARLSVAMLLVLVSVTPATAQDSQRARIRDKIVERMQSRKDPATTKPIISDVAYGTHHAQRYDVYLPATPAKNAPVIFMVHGGGWRNGDKTMSRTVTNKSVAFTARGSIFISANYRMLPDADPLTQAQDVAAAMAHAQSQAPTWGGDAKRFVLMGHSAGAHLVALVSTHPDLMRKADAQIPLATVGLDSGGYDLETTMHNRHFKLYDDAFGSDPAYWQATSPMAQMNSKIVPFLAVCSTQRKTPCDDAARMQKKAHGFGSVYEILPVDLDHGDINDKLGLDNTYTSDVLAFLQKHAGL